MADLTVRQLESMRKQAQSSGKEVIVNESSGRGAGVLRIRVMSSGKVSFYYRYTDAQGRRDDMPIGVYATDGRGGLTLEKARTRIGELKLLYRSGIKDVRLYLETKEREEAEARRREAAELAKQQGGTLRALVECYVNHLRDHKKESWSAVKRDLTRHVLDPFPDLAESRANRIESTTLNKVFARLIRKKFTRMLSKIRSDLHAAYVLAGKSINDARISEEFRLLAVTSNPISPIPTYKELSIAGNRVLSHAELADLLRWLKNSESMAEKAILVALYLGGQRPSQLLRVTASDVDRDRNTIRLWDRKGRRDHPREHLLPLEPVRSLIDECLQINSEAPSEFSSDGKRPTNISTLSDHINAFSHGEYDLKDIRRTCATEFSRLRISKDISAD